MEKEEPQKIATTGIVLPWMTKLGGIHVGGPLPNGEYKKCGGQIDYTGTCLKCGKAVY